MNVISVQLKKYSSGTGRRGTESVESDVRRESSNSLLTAFSHLNRVRRY
jgi:hypothetical protein